jgi:thiamine biosynthesis lipoprotein
LDKLRGILRIGLIGFWGAGLAVAGAQQKTELHRFTFTEYHMGVDARLVVYAPSQQVAVTACTAAFERIAALDSIMSDYQIRSELMRLSDRSGTGPVAVSPELFKVLTVSQKISSLSEGLFDVTIGPLVRVWRKARKTGVLPTPEEIRQARKLVGWKNMTLDPASRSVRLALRGMKLDLGAIGKGYADDEAQIVLRAHGITRALVDMGGDIVVTDPPPGEAGWSFEIPNAGKSEEDVPKMRFANCAVSTSGDTEEFAMIGGKRYSHVIDPHTGQALTQRVQATVITKTGLLADPISTAMTLLGPRGRKRLLHAYPDLKVYVKKLPGR